MLLTEIPPSLPYDPDFPVFHHQEAFAMTLALPDLDWAQFRRTIKSAHHKFIHPTEQDSAPDSPDSCSPGSSLPSPSCSQPPPPSPENSDILAWGKAFLPDHFLQPPSPMHQWMARHLDRMTADRGTKLNVLGPRGGAKSTVATLAYPLREALLAREPYIWILSDTAHQAHAHLENLKAELLDNPLFVLAYASGFDGLMNNPE